MRRRLAAVVLGLPYEQHGSVVRNAFVAALAVIAAASAIVGVVPAIAAEVADTIRVSDPFYPWLASRYLAGLLFVSAAAQWPRLGLRTYVGVSLAVFLVAAAALTRVRTPPEWLAPAGVGDLGLGARVGLELRPLLLFGFGAWLAARLALRGGVPLARRLSLSLLVGVFTQVRPSASPRSSARR